MDVLEIKGLEKAFGDKRVLTGLELCVPEGSIFGFIGKNGSGKTTTMKAVLGLLAPDGGEISVCGEHVRYGQTPTNKYIGYLPDVPEFYSFMNAREYLTFCGELCGMVITDIKLRTSELLTLVGLEGETHRIKGFSRGMKQRLGLAQALLCRPRLLICDEPTSALDPIGRKEILDILVSVREQTTVLFSTHILSDVEKICTDIALLDGGKNIICGKTESILSNAAKHEFSVLTSESTDAKRLADAFPGTRCAGESTVVFSEKNTDMHAVISYLCESGIRIEKIEKCEPDIESLFLEVTRK